MTLLDDSIERGDGARPGEGWAAVCPLDRLDLDRGVAALVHGTAVAVFRLSNGEICVIDNVDPCSGANVLSRGLIGDVDGVATVASPLYKQRFDLRTGACLDEPGTAVAVHAARVVDGVVEVSLRR